MMMFRPSREPGNQRFLYARVGAFFLGAGIWVGAMITGRQEFTLLAIAILFVGLILGLIGRRPGRD